MEWLALLVLIPAIVVPVVLLLGFAGCDVLFLTEHTPVFEVAFTETLTTNQGQASQTIVQRIEPIRLFAGGSDVQITIRASDANDLMIDKMYISRPVPNGTGNPYDSAGDLTEVFTQPMLVPQGTSVVLPVVSYALDKTQPLLVIFDTGMPGAVRMSNNVPAAEAVAFIGPDGEADVAARQPPPAYVTVNRIYLVERIDVL